MTTPPRFHLAFPVHSLAEARAFYGGLLGCREGRSSDEWVDFDFFGHQIVAHLSASQARTQVHNHMAHNAVDGEAVPVRHFGVILNLADWRELAQKLQKNGANFIIEPQTRFEGEAGEQATFFITDPSGNALEFKAFADEGMVFAK